MPNRFMLIIAAILAAVFLTSCQDKVEVEERGYAGAIAIDKTEDGRFLVAVELLELKEKGGKDQDDSGKRLLTQSGETVEEALSQINSHSAKRLNLGLAKVCLIGQALLGDTAMFREAVDVLERNNEINNMLLVLAVDGEGSKAFENRDGNDISTGFFISKYYANNKGTVNEILRLELEDLTAALWGDGCIMIPAFNTGDGPDLSGAAAISKGRLTGWLSDGDVKGLAWITGRLKKINATAETEGCKAAFTVTKTKTNLEFYVTDGVLHCLAVIDAEAALDSLSPPFTADSEMLELLEEKLAERITEEAARSFTSAKRLGIDCYDLARRLEKQEPELFARFDDILGQIVFTAQASVNILNTGSIK